MTFLQFGEAANGSMVHLWNYLSLTRDESSEDADLNDDFFTSEGRPKTLIFSEKLGLKGIISQEPLNAPIENDSSAAANSIINQKTGHWTDSNYATNFPEALYQECSEFDPSKRFLTAFYDSKTKGSFLIEFEEQVRKQAEASDWMDKFNLITQSSGSIGASTLHSLEYLNDEFVKASKIVLSFSERVKITSASEASWENCDAFDGGEIGRALKTALTFNSIVEEHVSFVPLASFSKSTRKLFDVPLNEPKESSRLFSAIFHVLFKNTYIPANGRFGSLLVTESTNDNPIHNLTNDLEISRSTPMIKSRNAAPLAKYIMTTDNQIEYDFEQINLSAQVDFNQKSISTQAASWLNTINRPRALWQELEAAGMSAELAGGDYYNEFLETLHQIKDLATYE